MAASVLLAILSRPVALVSNGMPIHIQGNTQCSHPDLACAPASLCACWPTTSSGTCARRSPRFSSTMTTPPPGRPCGAPLSARLTALPKRSGRPLPKPPMMASPFTASAHYWLTPPPSLATPVNRARPTPPAFEKIPTRTPVQQRALQLLNVDLPRFRGRLGT